MTNKANDNVIKVFISSRESVCDGCGEALGRRAWITLKPDKGALCLACGDLDHLLFLPSGDAALTRRAKKGSTLSAIVLKWSKARKRYERQGLLVEEEALHQAEESCLSDGEARARRRGREAERRQELDEGYMERFAERVRELYPYAPTGREHTIARHACLKYSGRVGRSAAAKNLEADTIRLAVIAHVRHQETPYDELLSTGRERFEARALVESQVSAVLHAWETKESF